ncbi:MAG: peptide ABC transporter substrate-binding protein [Candidatus Eremiobacteraeota bacterium]|nr:peptide ABC transporter substrate-binding protein [Candidatus Eremiobacteraeota bacterium]
MNRLLRLSALMLTAVLASCSARGAETRDPDMVICGWIAGPDSLNPLTTIGSTGKMIQDSIFTPLVAIAPNQLPRWETSLAKRIDITDSGKRYVIHLRRAQWSDGKPLTARDVVFTIKLSNNHAVLQPLTSDFGLMTSVRMLDPYTVEIRLSRPSPPFLTNALGQILPLPEHILGKYPADSEEQAKFINTDAAFSRDPVVSGPWRVLHQVPDSYLVLERNPRYWGPQPYIPRIAFRVYPQQDSLYAALDANEIDVTDIPPNLWRIHGRLRGNHKAVNWPWNVTFYLLPNFRHPQAPFLHELAVRQAMMHAIDRKFIIDGIMSGQADLLDGPIPRFSPHYDKSIFKYTYDPKRARELLEAAGWHLSGNAREKNGVRLRITLKTGGATDAVASNIAELIQANLRAIGIDCILQNEEISTFFADVNKSNFQLALRGKILNPYPDDYYLFDSSQTKQNGGRNAGFYANPAADRAIEAARTAATPEEARKALNDWQEIAARDLPAIFLYSNRLGALVPADMTGFELNPNAPAALPMGLEFWRRTGRNP